MTALQLDAQQLAQAIARFRLAERDAGQALVRIDTALDLAGLDTHGPCAGCLADAGEPCDPFCLSYES